MIPGDTFKKAFFIIILPVLYMVSGCSTLKPPTVADRMWIPPVQERITAQETAVSVMTGKARISATKPLTLARCVDIALANSPTTQAAWISAQKAEDQLKQTEAEWYPKVTGYLNANLEKQDLNYKTVNTTTEYAYYGPALTVTYLLFDFGGRDARVQQAVETLRISNFLFNQAIQDLVLHVEQAYYSLYSAQKTVEIERANVKDVRKILYLTKRKFGCGMVPAVDLHKARARYEDELYALAQAEGSEETSKANLANVLGLPADMAFEITVPSDHVMMDMTREDVTRLINEGLANRSDLSALRADIRAKEAAVKAADSSLWPRINAQVSSYGNDYDYHRSTTTEISDDSKYAGFIGLTWDIFDGFHNWNVRRAAEKDLALAREELKKYELKTSSDIWSAYYDVKASDRKRKHSRAFLHEARTAFGMVVKGYEAGLQNMLDLLTAQRDLSDARLKKIQGDVGWFVSLAKLIHSAGGLSSQKDIDERVLGMKRHDMEIQP